jgi:hypothetical protein
LEISKKRNKWPTEFTENCLFTQGISENVPQVTFLRIPIFLWGGENPSTLESGWRIYRSLRTHVPSLSLLNCHHNIMQQSGQESHSEASPFAHLCFMTLSLWYDGYESQSMLPIPVPTSLGYKCFFQQILNLWTGCACCPKWQIYGALRYNNWSS